MIQAPWRLAIALGLGICLSPWPASAQENEQPAGASTDGADAAGADAAGASTDGADAAGADAAVPKAPPAGGAKGKPADPVNPVSLSSASEAHEVKLRGLEERVNELKEKIFRTKARILQLQETVVSGAIGAGARSVILHRNEMSGSFRLVSVQYALDTAPIFKKVDVDGDLDSIEEREIDSRNIVPGNHNIAVQMVFQGEGYGFFSYVKGYKFTVTSSYTFTAEEGKVITIKVVAFERGGVTTSLEDRPAVRYDIQIEKLTPDRAKVLQEKAEEAG